MRRRYRCSRKLRRLARLEALQRECRRVARRKKEARKRRDRKVRNRETNTGSPNSSGGHWRSKRRSGQSGHGSEGDVCSEQVLACTRTRSPRAAVVTRRADSSWFVEAVRVNVPRRVVAARWVGCRRFGRVRRSPGCGVNRRRRRVPSLSEVRWGVVEGLRVLSKPLCLRFVVMCSLCFPVQQTSLGALARLRS